MNPEPLITISIVSHGDASRIDSLLASLQKQEQDSKQFQLILTDNLQDDLPDFDPSPWGSLVILRNNHPMGFAENHNRAFEYSQGKYLAILNPDLIFEQPVFDRLINGLHVHHADLIAPLIMDGKGVVQDSCRTLPTPLEVVHRRLPGYRFRSPDPDLNGLIFPDWIAAMFWFMPSAVYRSLKGMDEKYRLYFEDVDFCTRARLKGLRLVVDSQVQVQHDAQRASRKKLIYLFWHIQSAFRFFISPVYRKARQGLKNRVPAA